MEDRAPEGLVLVFADCKDPAREKDLDRWYGQEYFPALVSAGPFVAASRWVDTSPQHGDRKHLAIYETSGDPVSADARLLQQKLKAWDHGAHPHHLLAGTKAMFFRHIAQVSRPGYVTAGKRTQGFMMVFSNCTDPAKEDEFNKWYSEEHLPSVISRWGFYTASRWVNVKPQPGDRKYLAIYETDNDPTDLFAAMGARLAEVGRGIKRVAVPSSLADTTHSLYRRIA